MRTLQLLSLFSILLFVACEKDDTAPLIPEADQALDFRSSCTGKVSVAFINGANQVKYICIDRAAVPAQKASGRAVDEDGDGFYHLAGPWGEADCNDDPNDGGAAINPGASEDCGDGIDNNCDNLIDNEDTENCAPPVEVGDEFAGGIVFYLADPPVDLNGDGTPDQGLVAAPEDQTTFFGAPWGNFQEAGCFDTDISGADGTDIGTGKQNTDDILAACSNSPNIIAASLASSYDGGGYSDWFLPARDELFLIWEHLAAQGIGGLAGDYYWSSTEFSIFDANWVYMGDPPPSIGRIWYTSKNFSFRVRAVRAF